MTVLTHPTTLTDPDRSTCTWRWEEHRARWSITDDRMSVSGEIDQASCDIVREGLVHAMHDRRVTLIDLTGVTFFSASAVTLLIEFAFHHRATVIGNPMIERVLGIVSCSHLLSEVVDPSNVDSTPGDLAPTA